MFIMIEVLKASVMARRYSFRIFILQLVPVKQYVSGLRCTLIAGTTAASAWCCMAQNAPFWAVIQLSLLKVPQICREGSRVLSGRVAKRVRVLAVYFFERISCKANYEIVDEDVETIHLYTILEARTQIGVPRIAIGIGCSQVRVIHGGCSQIGVVISFKFPCI